MAVVDIKAIARKAWKEVCSSVKNACVFMDDGAAESLHWSGGVIQLLNAGAIHIAELSPFEVVPDGCQKAVFVTTSAITDDVSDTIRDIVLNGKGRLLYVAVVTAVPAASHVQLKSDAKRKPEVSNSVFEHLEDRLLEWMGNANFTAEVVHFPFDIAAVTDDLFIISSQGADWSPLEGILPDSDEAIPANLPQQKQAKLQSLVVALDSFLGSAGVLEECYYVGNTSARVATMLASGWPLSAVRKRKATVGASLLFVDRVLDLPSCLRHDPDSYLDRVLQTHEHFSHQHSDVGIDMRLLVGLPQELSAQLLLRGCLSPHATLDISEDSPAAERSEPATSPLSPLDALLNARSKVDALAECLRRLTEAATAERLQLRQGKLGSRISAGEVLALVQLFRSRYGSIRRHCSLLQISLAVCQSLDPASGCLSLDKLCQLEKVLMQSIGEGEVTAAIEKLDDIIQKHLQASTSSHGRPSDNNSQEYTSRQLLGLVLYVLSLIDGAHDASLSELQPALVSLVRHISDECLSAAEDIAGSIPSAAGEETVIRRLLGVHRARTQALQQHRSSVKVVPVSDGMASPPRLDPLVRRLVSHALDRDLPLHSADIKHAASSGGITGGGGSAGSLLKTGLGLFKSKVVAAPHPADKSLLIIFVIGGVTASEVKQCREAVAAAGIIKTKQVIIGSTRLIADKDVVESLLHTKD